MYVIISFRTLDEDALLVALEERGLVEQVVKTLNLSQVSQSQAEPSPSRGEVADGEGGEGEGEREGESPRISPQHLHHRLSSPDGKKSSLS